MRFGNTGGNYYIGADNNTGSRIQNGTAIPYAFVFNSESARDMLFMTNNTVRLAINGTTGNVTTTTQSAGDNSTKVATTAYVDAATNSTTGTWTPASAAVTLSVIQGNYVTSGKMTTPMFYVTFPTSVST
jgi:hypothetical protein